MYLLYRDSGYTSRYIRCEIGEGPYENQHSKPLAQALAILTTTDSGLIKLL